MNIGKAVKKFRKEKGWSRTRLCEESGCVYTTVSGIENSLFETRISTLSQLAETLGVKLSDIVLEAEKYD